MIRPTTPGDTEPLVAIAEGTGVFRPIEVEALREVLDDYHEANASAGHRSVTLEEEGRVLGMAYYAPAAMTDRTWYLWWILVGKPAHRSGLGSLLLRHAEEAVAAAEGRLLLIETSSTPHYAPTRGFYLKHGYETAAVIRDYYAEGDDLVVFSKRFYR